MDTREAILSFIREKGPSLPSHIAKHIKANNLMASAHLAELTATGKLKSSWLKIGGSPIYHLPGQETLLEQFSDNLQEKEKKAYDLLKGKGILRDTDLEPVMRVALRNVKDFAVPLSVTYGDQQEIFWRFHSTPLKEAESLIDSMISPQASPETQQELILRPAPKEAVQPLQEKINPVAPAPSPHPLQLAPGTDEKKPERQKDPGTFEKDVLAFFDGKGISIIGKNVVKRNTDMEFTIALPSVFGPLEYYCRAKKKKRLGDADITNAFVQGQLRKLPVVVISPGELTKKAGEMMASLKGITFFRME